MYFKYSRGSVTEENNVWLLIKMLSNTRPYKITSLNQLDSFKIK